MGVRRNGIDIAIGLNRNNDCRGSTQIYGRTRLTTGNKTAIEVYQLTTGVDVELARRHWDSAKDRPALIVKPIGQRLDA